MIKCLNNTSVQKKLKNSPELPLEPLLIGIQTEKSAPLEPKEEDAGIYLKISSKKTIKTIKTTKSVSVTVESLPMAKKKTFKDKLTISDKNTQTTKLLKILDRASTLKEKVLTPFWNKQSKVIFNVREIVVTHKDRLCRFAFDLIEGIVKRGDGKILVLDQKETSPEEELVNDLLSIVTVFSSRLYGLRSHKLKRKIKKQALKNSEDEDIPHGDGETETTIHV